MCGTVAVTIDGALWAWGHGGDGQLGLGDEESKLVPARVESQVEFGGSPVLMAACGDRHPGCDEGGHPVGVGQWSIWCTPPQRRPQEAVADTFQ